MLEGATPPLEWSTTANIAWSVEIPGRGWSSPVAWNDRVFVTSAINPGAFKPPSPGIFGTDYWYELEAQGLSEEEVTRRFQARDIEQTDEAGEVRYMVYGLDATTGRVRWSREAHRGEPFRGRHRKNTYASETPATDGERVYAYFGNVGLFCYTVDGDPVWQHRFEPQPMHLDIGTASSPVVHGGRVYVLQDTEARSFLAAFDAETGREIWVAERHLKDGPMTSGWSSPFVWSREGRTEIVAIGQGFAIGYGLDGQEAWRLGGLTGQSTPSPVAAGGLLFVGTGSQGDANRPMFAVRPAVGGAATAGAGSETGSAVAWSRPRASAYTGSPLVYRGRMYVANDNGILTVYDAASGDEIYRARLGGVGNTFSASPVAADGKVFFLSEEGDTFVLEAGDTYVELAKNSLGEMTLASPALAPDGLLVRTATRLYRIAAR